MLFAYYISIKGHSLKRGWGQIGVISEPEWTSNIVDQLLTTVTFSASARDLPYICYGCSLLYFMVTKTFSDKCYTLLYVNYKK